LHVHFGLSQCSSLSPSRDLTDVLRLAGRAGWSYRTSLLFRFDALGGAPGIAIRGILADRWAVVPAYRPAGFG
jgi:hypothetical protein